MRRWVLMGGWRDALYSNEPNREIISGSLVGYYCGVLEGIAWPVIHHSPNPPMPLVVPSTPGGEDSVTSSRCGQSTLNEPISDNGPNDNPGSTSGCELDCEIVTKSVFEVNSEPEEQEEQEEWPLDAVTDIFAGLYLPSCKVDAVYGPMPVGMD
ncbi:unnamed protein product [Penicillium nalgiovense]|uniref:Uncharacterized protein n=1 Tax=Penicillium nalgiovense TaxID=60175 RepID=A0A9W4N5V5_PENNA|nr:unnamed protein product [Penicillium nalgiovense]CAG7994208.1 unnamed protein product [Penicillium nalgiovense]CAG8022676.1 unnamed protein product [Penicillium nalgiovense]CAG8044050.1 unnamed protein product [Penicillium nalgiovense]CAG8068105.1 unnamed protein product [Penicillium nalgiovense]